MTANLPPPIGVAPPRARRAWGFFAAGFVAGATSAAAALVLLAMQWAAPQLSARLEAPETVSVGQHFEVRIHVHNPTQSPSNSTTSTWRWIRSTRLNSN